MKAYDRNPRVGGEHIANIEIVSVTRFDRSESGHWPDELIHQIDINGEHGDAEGLQWMVEHRLKCPGEITPLAYVSNMLANKDTRALYVVDFTLEEPFLNIEDAIEINGGRYCWYCYRSKATALLNNGREYCDACKDMFPWLSASPASAESAAAASASPA